MIDFVVRFPVLCTFLLGLAMAYMGASITNVHRYAKYWKYADCTTVIGVLLMVIAGLISLL